MQTEDGTAGPVTTSIPAEVEGQLFPHQYAPAFRGPCLAELYPETPQDDHIPLSDRLFPALRVTAATIVQRNELTIRL